MQNFRFIYCPFLFVSIHFKMSIRYCKKLLSKILPKTVEDDIDNDKIVLKKKQNVILIKNNCTKTIN
jgi:hypothetical protein